MKFIYATLMLLLVTFVAADLFHVVTLWSEYRTQDVETHLIFSVGAVVIVAINAYFMFVGTPSTALAHIKLCLSFFGQVVVIGFFAMYTKAAGKIYDEENFGPDATWPILQSIGVLLFLLMIFVGLVLWSKRQSMASHQPLTSTLGVLGMSQHSDNFVSPHIPIRSSLRDGLSILHSLNCDVVEEPEGCFMADKTSFKVAIYAKENEVGSVWYDDLLGRDSAAGKERKIQLYLERYGALSNWELRMDNGWMHYWFNPKDKVAMVYGIHKDVIRFNQYNEPHAYVSGWYLMSLKCPQCGTPIMKNELFVFGINTHMWKPFLKKNCSDCGRKID